jgi:DNA-binding winged helix-turn-helix (wHTH) protein
MPTRYTEITAGGRCYRLDRQAKAVFKERAELHHVTSQQMQLLELFVSNPQHALVTRDQIFEHLYKDKAVTNEAVDLAVKSLRKALGPGFIATDPRKGYRLVSDIRHFEGDDLAPSPSERASSVSSQALTPSPDYSAGDWITAAIVGPERAVTWLKGAAARLSRLLPEDRKVEIVEKYLEDKIDDLLIQHQKGGSTDDARLEACVAKAVSDILSHELENFLWNVGEKPSTDDVVSIFRDTVRELAKKPGSNSASPEADLAPGKKDTNEHPSQTTKLGMSADTGSRERDTKRSERNNRLVAALKAYDGIGDCWVMQLEDHSDKGYLASVEFDPARRSAAETASLIRSILDDMEPHVPFWGELKNETENSVSFAYTYIDEYNRIVR